jgi:hypothetical protein
MGVTQSRWICLRKTSLSPEFFSFYSLYFICTTTVSWLSWLCLVSLLYKTHNTNIHAPGGIRTRNPSKQSAADPRLRPLGHWNRQGIDHRNFQPITSRYTDYASPNPTQLKGTNKSYFACKVQSSIKLAALQGLITAVGSTDVNCVASWQWFYCLKLCGFLTIRLFG